MHEYTKKTIDGIEYGIYQEEGIYLQFPFVDDADAQMKINAYLETAHLEELKEKYPDTWEEELAKENGLSEEVSLTPSLNLPIENVEEI
tara:strand:- start:3703 stop:3969 length:267 start_codon:yes stop_codon:yes gene_type:complete